MILKKASATFGFFLFFMLSSGSLSAQTGDWCAELKKLKNFAENEPAKITGEKLTGTDYITWYKCPVSFPGADFVETKYFTEGRLFQVVIYYATGASEAETDKIYNDLIKKMKLCYPDAEEIDHAYELGFDVGWGFYDEAAYCSIRAGKAWKGSSIEHHKQRSNIQVVIEY